MQAPMLLASRGSRALYSDADGGPRLLVAFPGHPPHHRQELVEVDLALVVAGSSCIPELGPGPAPPILTTWRSLGSYG